MLGYELEDLGGQLEDVALGVTALALPKRCVNRTLSKGRVGNSAGKCT